MFPIMNLIGCNFTQLIKISMIQKIKNIFGIGPKVNIDELIAAGAMIMDVRSRQEYLSGHVKGSVNIPLDQLNDGIKKLKNKEQVIITCCASGMRSGVAKTMLKSNGFTIVHNGGSWMSLKKYSK
jgi:phage shock protein E